VTQARKVLRARFKRRTMALRACFDEWRMWQTPMILTDRAAALAGGNRDRERPAVLLAPTRVFHVWSDQRHVLGGGTSAVTAQRLNPSVANMFT